MDLLDQDVEEHFLKNGFNPQEGLPRVHFKPEMGDHTSKNQDPPEYLRQLALEIIDKIPAAAMQIYTDELSQQHEIYFQWIPSHIGLFGSDTADLLAKEGVTEDLMSRRTLTLSENFLKTKSLIQELWKTPPTHSWYNRQAPGGALSKADRVVQTTISRLASGHTRGLSFHLGQKIYENRTKCNLVLATPDHLLKMFNSHNLFKNL
ncbi:RNase H domain-containing protein [Trichonephila clavipes]|nr:RNase H domain-containing protein [Trichonephila clavipes]